MVVTSDRHEVVVISDRDEVVVMSVDGWLDQ